MALNIESFMEGNRLISNSFFLKFNTSVIMVLLPFVVPYIALAEENKVGAHKIAGMDVSAVITSSLGYGDNIFRGSDQKTDSTFLSIEPLVEAISETASRKLVFSYHGNGVAFFESSEDNYLSNKISGEFIRKLNKVSEFNVGVSFEDGSTVRGVDITEGSNGDVKGATDFTRSDFALGYAIGSPKIGPSLELDYTHTDLEFDNFKLINQGRDYKLEKLSARLGYQYSVVTKLFADLSYSDFDYNETPRYLNGQLDNTEQAALVGVKWRLSRLMSGEVSVGRVDKQFDNFQDPASFTSWNMELEWTPTARDTLTIESFSRPFEQAGTGLFQDIDQTSIAWEHDVSRTIRVKGGATFGSVDFGTVTRDDDYDTFLLGLFYRPTSYSEWSLNYEHEDKSSNLPRFNFQTNTVFLSYSYNL